MTVCLCTYGNIWDALVFCVLCMKCIMYQFIPIINQFILLFNSAAFVCFYFIFPSCHSIKHIFPSRHPSLVFLLLFSWTENDCVILWRAFTLSQGFPFMVKVTPWMRIPPLYCKTKNRSLCGVNLAICVLKCH